MNLPDARRLLTKGFFATQRRSCGCHILAMTIKPFSNNLVRRSDHLGNLPASQ
jgi:hypothetical protein